MKRSELFEKFAACVKMVEDSGETIALYKMVKIDGEVADCMPHFVDKFIAYSFAVGIIGSTPVFVGDTVYHNRNGVGVITKSIGPYVYYSVNCKENGWNDYMSTFSLVNPNTIKLEDVKPFAIFRYDDQEVMILPAEYTNDSITRFVMSGARGDFSRQFSISAKTQEEMYKYITTPNSGCTTIYVKTGKRFGLIEG